MVAPNDPSSTPKRPVSAAKQRANRANAQKSTGPRTPEGKARSSRNGTTHGIFCRDLVLPGEDLRLFRIIREGFIDRIRPQDFLELALVDRIAQAQWRLNRCQAAESQEHTHQVTRTRERAERGIRRIKRRHGIETRQDLLDDPQPGDERVLAELDELEQLARRECKIARYRGVTLHLALQSNLFHTIERLAGYEQKLERTIQRALFELRMLRGGKDASAWDNLPKSPFAGEMVPGYEEEHEGEDEVDDAATPSPQPSPLSTGQREQDALTSPRKTEPTAENPAASSDAAESSDDAPRQLDEQEDTNHAEQPPAAPDDAWPAAPKT